MERLKKIEIGTYAKFACMYIFVSIGVILFSYLIHNGAFDKTDTFVDFYNKFSSKWDVRHYIFIAQNGYPSAGDEALVMVFFPFYPLCIRILHTLTTLDYEICAAIISNVCGFFSLIMLYKLVSIDFSEKTAYNCVKFYIFYPFSFFLFTKMSEGLFMLLLLSTIYNLRKKRYFVSGILGYMLALTRLPGLAVGVIMLAETIISFVKDLQQKLFRFKNYVSRILMMVMTLSGFLTYLFINYYVHNDALKFLEFQESNWNQTFKGPIYVLQTTFQQMSDFYGTGFNIGVGFGNLLSMILILAAFLFALKKLRLSYALYTLVYLIVCYSPSWLLSGPRYSLGAFTLFMFAGIVTEKSKLAGDILTVIFGMMMILFCLLYYPGYMY